MGSKIGVIGEICGFRGLMVAEACRTSLVVLWAGCDSYGNLFPSTKQDAPTIIVSLGGPKSTTCALP
jgi:hypothetical protein